VLAQAAASVPALCLQLDDFNRACSVVRGHTALLYILRICCLPSILLYPCVRAAMAESWKVHLMAVTSNGRRAFLTTNPLVRANASWRGMDSRGSSMPSHLDPKTARPSVLVAVDARGPLPQAPVAGSRVTTDPTRYGALLLECSLCVLFHCAAYICCYCSVWHCLAVLLPIPCSAVSTAE
jgi:hypothetical protein